MSIHTRGSAFGLPCSRRDLSPCGTSAAVETGQHIGEPISIVRITLWSDVDVILTTLEGGISEGRRGVGRPYTLCVLQTLPAVRVNTSEEIQSFVHDVVPHLQRKVLVWGVLTSARTPGSLSDQ